MYRLVCVGAALLCLSLCGMDEIVERSSDAPSVKVNTSIPREDSAIFVPENVDVTCCLESSTKFCYVVHWLCKVGVGACEIASLVCGGVGITKISENPDVAWRLGLASTIIDGATLGLTYALFQTEVKIRKLDRAVGEARRHRMQTEL